MKGMVKVMKATKVTKVTRATRVMRVMRMHSQQLQLQITRNWIAQGVIG